MQKTVETASTSSDFVTCTRLPQALGWFRQVLAFPKELPPERSAEALKDWDEAIGDFRLAVTIAEGIRVPDALAAARAGLGEALCAEAALECIAGATPECVAEATPVGQASPPARRGAGEDARATAPECVAEATPGGASSSMLREGLAALRSSAGEYERLGMALRLGHVRAKIARWEGTAQAGRQADPPLHPEIGRRR